MVLGEERREEEDKGPGLVRRAHLEAQSWTKASRRSGLTTSRKSK